VTFDHLAFLVRDTARTLDALWPFFPKVTLLKHAHDLQRAFITYVRTTDGRVTLELVQPFESNTLLVNRLDREKQECLPYHICVRVDDFDTEYTRMRRAGWLTLTRPFGGLGVGTQGAHLYKLEAGIVEIVGRRSEK
jgi:hypothetical protein